MKTIGVLLFACLFAVAAFAQEKKDEFPKTKFSGLIFGDYYYNALRDSNFNKGTMTGSNALSGKSNENSVKINRILFTFEHKMAKNLEALFRLESAPSTSTGNSLYGTFVKDAYMKWGYYKTHNVQFGLFSTGAWDVSESFWLNRNVEKTISDLRGAASARDFGIGLNGKIDSLGKMKYSVMFGEGLGVATYAVDWYKRYFGTFTYSPILELNDKKEVAKELAINLFADFKEAASKTNPYYNTDGSRGEKNLNGNVMHFTLFVGYKEKDKYSFGLECYYNQAKNGFNYVDTDDPLKSKLINKNGIGLSVFGTYNVSEKSTVFGRFDYFDPNSYSSKGAKGDSRNFIILGGSYSPAKNMSISPNVAIETYEKIAEGKVNTDGTKSDLKFGASITPRVTFLYVFK